MKGLRDSFERSSGPAEANALDDGGICSDADQHFDRRSGVRSWAFISHSRI